MKCDDCLAIIEEYFDAELGERDSAKVAEHIAVCAGCNEVYQSLQQEQQLYVHYQRDVEVTSVLWQGVQSRIRQEAARQEIGQQPGVVERLRRFFTETFHAPRFSPALAAMLVVIAVGATVLVMKYVNSNSPTPTIAENNTNSTNPAPASDGNRNAAPQPPPNQIADVPTSGDKDAPENAPKVRQTPVKVPVGATRSPQTVAAVKPNATAEDLLRDAEMKYIKAIVILERDFDKRRSKLDAKLVAKLDNSLASIDRTIAETRKAVHQNPGDPIALQYMLTAYAKKVEVLKDVTTN
jgi:hypothetical protein